MNVSQPQLPVEGVPVAFPTSDDSEKEVLTTQIKRYAPATPTATTPTTAPADLVNTKFLTTRFGAFFKWKILMINCPLFIIINLQFWGTDCPWTTTAISL